MKAVVQESYGPPEVLRIVEIEKTAVPENGVLVRVHAGSVNIADWYGMTGLLVARIAGGLLRPKGRIRGYHPRKMAKFLV